MTELLTEDAFYYQNHRIVYEAIAGLLERGDAVDIISVNDELRRRGRLGDVGGAAFLAGLLSTVATTGHARRHAQIVHEHFLRRRVMHLGMQSAVAAGDMSRDVFDVLDGGRQAFDDLLTRGATRGRRDEIAARVEVLTDVYETVLDPESEHALQTGFGALDRLTGGLRGGELVVLAGRPGSGKTALALSAACIITGLIPGGPVKPAPVALFELEMGVRPTWYRVLSQITKIDGSRFGRAGNAWTPGELARISDAFARVTRAPLYIDTHPYYTLPALRARIRQLVDGRGVQAVMIDVAAKIQVPRGFSRNDEVEEIYKNLKAMAKEFDLPIVALCHLNRECEKRHPPRPQLADLRDSGAIEQEADQVWMCYRPEYYRGVEYEDGSSVVNAGDVQIEKNRQGSVGVVRLAYMKTFAQWANLHTHT